MQICSQIDCVLLIVFCFCLRTYALQFCCGALSSGGKAFKNACCGSASLAARRLMLASPATATSSHHITPGNPWKSMEIQKIFLYHSLTVLESLGIPLCRAHRQPCLDPPACDNLQGDETFLTRGPDTTSVPPRGFVEDVDQC